MNLKFPRPLPARPLPPWPASPLAQEKIVIQYDCIPNYANWGGVTALYKKVSGVTVPPDPKGSSVALAALEKEKDSPQADTAYYSGAIGFQAAEKGLHEAYKPKGWEKIPAALKDPAGLWWTVHTGTIAFVVNTKALGGAPVPRSWKDLLKPVYKGKIAYDDPTWGGTSYTLVYGVNTLFGGSEKNFRPGLDYLKKLDANVSSYPQGVDLQRGAPRRDPHLDQRRRERLQDEVRGRRSGRGRDPRRGHVHHAPGDGPGQGRAARGGGEAVPRLAADPARPGRVRQGLLPARGPRRHAARRRLQVPRRQRSTRGRAPWTSRRWRGPRTP